MAALLVMRLVVSSGSFDYAYASLRMTKCHIAPSPPRMPHLGMTNLVILHRLLRLSLNRLYVNMSVKVLNYIYIASQGWLYDSPLC